MRSISRPLAVVVLFAFLSVTLGAVDGKKAQYIGGTVNSVAEKAEGILDTRNEIALTFTPGGKSAAGLSIPYATITEIEYGQKAGRRVAAAVLISPWLLFSKKRKHFMTVTFTDDAGKEQAAVFELGKDISRTTLTIVETRSGKDIQYQDDEARKAGRGGN